MLDLSVGTVLIGLWLSRRQIRVADRYAAERTGAAVLSDSLDRYADVHAIEPTRRGIPNPLSVTVALGDRGDGLRLPTDT